MRGAGPAGASLSPRVRRAADGGGANEGCRVACEGAGWGSWDSRVADTPGGGWLRNWDMSGLTGGTDKGPRRKYTFKTDVR